MSDFPLYAREPSDGGWINDALFDDFLRWAVTDRGASDVKITPNDPVFLSISGQWVPATLRPMSLIEVSSLVDSCSRDSASTKAAMGLSKDFAYELMKIEGDRRKGFWRFRANVTACSFGRSTGLSLTMRSIPDTLPDLESLGVSPDLMQHMFPHHGLVSIAGVMGSGKTTTMAGIMRHLRLNTRRSIMTVEKPIEFDYTRVPGAIGPMEQMEVPSMIESFQEGIISATRKAANVLLVGETNDRLTMESMVHAAEVGIAVYHTIHTQEVSAIPSRIIHQFPSEEASGIAVSFLSSTRLMIQQRLYPRVGGGRVALREWLAPDDSMRQKLVDTPTDKIQPVLEQMVRSFGRSMIDEARDALKDGLIDQQTFHYIEKEKS